jgi:hypothetical protein
LLGILLGDLPIGRLPIRFERDEYLDVLGILTESSDHVPADMAVSHVFNALRHRSSNFAPRMLARHEWIAKDSRFWHFLCDQVGKGADDAELLTILSEHWHVPAACATFPLELLDAWLRMAERGAETDPSLHYLVSSGLLDLEYLAQNRPDLIKRTRNALRELGHEWDFTL